MMKLEQKEMSKVCDVCKGVGLNCSCEEDRVAAELTGLREIFEIAEALRKPTHK